MLLLMNKYQVIYITEISYIDEAWVSILLLSDKYHLTSYNNDN